MPHKVQVQAATVAGLGESRVVEEVLFSEEQGTMCIGPVLRSTKHTLCVNIALAEKPTFGGLPCSGALTTATPRQPGNRIYWCGYTFVCMPVGRTQPSWRDVER